MAGSTKCLKKYAKNKAKITLEKVDKAIRELSLTEQKINVNSVSQLSGVSKTFLEVSCMKNYRLHCLYVVHV